MSAEDRGHTLPLTREATQGLLAGSSLMPLWALGLIFVVFLLLTLVVLGPGFNAPMVYDSKEWISGKAHVFATRDPLQVIGIVPVRPLFMVSLHLNYLWHGMEPFFFRLVNAIVLVLSGVVLAILCLLVYEIPELRIPGSRRAKQIVAVFVATWFVVHPLQRFVVLYVWQREAILACLFYYSSVAMYLALRTNRVPQGLTGYILTAILFLAGLLSKENVATVPVVLVLAEATLMRQSFRQTIRRTLAIACFSIPVIVIYVLLTSHLYSKETVHPPGALARLYDHYISSGLSPFQVALTECRVLMSYVSAIIAPFGTTLPFIRAEVVSTSLGHPPVTAAAVGGVAAMIGLGIALIRKAPVISFGLLFFAISIGPESALIPTYLFFGYRAILPMAGILLILGYGCLELASRVPDSIRSAVLRPLALAALSLPLICMASLTYAQANRWNPLTFWQDGFAQVPDPPIHVESVAYLDIITGLSGELVHRGRYADAIRVLKRVDDFASETSRASSGDGRAATDTSGKAREVPETFPALPNKSKMASALLNLGLAYRKSGNSAEAMRQYSRALEMDPSSGTAYNNLASIWEESGDMQRALRTYAKAVDLTPGSAELHFNYACALLKAGDSSEAIRHFQKAVQLRPHYPQARANLGVALLQMGRPAEAVDNLQKAVASLKNNAELHNALGAALAEQGRTAEAGDHFRKALAIEPGHRGAQENLRTLLK